MDIPEVKSFNAELSGLYDNKPPISKAKMSAITKGAIKAIKFYKHVVHSVEKFIQKCKAEYKVPGLYVIDSIVRQSRHQFGQEKDVFAPRFAKNMQQTFANLFRCPPEDKRNIIRVLNLWQKNNVFTSQVIQPLLDMADPNHPLHQEIQMQNSTANGSSLNLSHNTSENKISPGPSSQHSPRMSSPMDGNQFQDEPSGPPNMKFNRKLLNDFEYESEDEPMMLDPPLPTSHSTHGSHSTHTSHSHSHTSHSNQPQQGNNTTDAMASILTNPEIMRQLQSLQAQMSLMTGMQIPNLMPMMSDMQLQQNQNQQGLPFLSQDQQNDGKDDMANESDIEFVDAGPQVIEIPDANDSRSPSPKSRRHRSRSKSPRRRGRRSRSRSRSPRRRRDRERERERDREKERDRDKGRDYKEREADREKQKEREKKGLPPIKKDNLSVCSTTLWVGHLSKLATPEELSDLFGGIGGVVSIDVVAPRGCAFVVMERRRDAYKALNKLNKHKLHTKEITVAWAPGKGVKGREWKEQWEAELGVSYLPWAALQARWALGELQLDALEDGGMVDEETLPPWLPPRIMPKSMMENISLMGLPPGMIALPPGLPPPMQPQLPPDMTAAALGSPANLAVTRMPPPGMPGGLPPGMPPGLPPGIRPPMPGVPGLAGEGMPPPGSMIRFPPGMPPQGLGQPGMVASFLPGLLGVGGMGTMGNMGNMGNMGMPNMPMFAPVLPQHAPPALQLPQQRPNDSNDDDAMDLDTEDMHQEEPNGVCSDINLPPPLLPDQIQAMLSKPPPKFNASEPPPGFNASEPPPFSQPPPTDDKQDDDRKSDRDRDRRERDRGDRDRRGGDRRDKDRDNRRGNERGNERANERRDRGNERDKDGGRDDRRDRDRGRDRRDRDRDRERGPARDNNNGDRSREKSPRQPGAPENAEKSLQERLWEMANGKQARPAGDHREDYPDRREEPREPLNDRMRLIDNEAEGPAPPPAAPDGWPAPRAPPFRAGPWMDGPPGPPGPFGPRFNGLGPFGRPPFERPPFDGMPPRFDRPPFRMPFDMSRPPFDGPRPSGPRPLFDGPRPPFDGMRAPFNGPRPAFDGARPAYDGARPAYDGPRPAYDESRSAYDGPPFDAPPGFEPPQEMFDRNNRRFEDREFGDRNWERRGEWDERPRPRDERPRDRQRNYDDKRPGRDERSSSKDDRPSNRDDRPPNRDDRPPNRDDRPPNRDDRPPNRDDRPPNRDDRSSNRDDRPLNRDDRSSNRDDWPPNRDDRPPNRDDRPVNRDDRPLNRDDRSSNRDDRPPNRDDRPPNREDRPPNRDDRPPNRDDRPPNRDDRTSQKDEPTVPKDVKNVPKEDRVTPDNKIVKDGPKDNKREERSERRRDRQDRKSRWGASQETNEPDFTDAMQEDSAPVIIPDEIKQKLQETIARFPQSESESQILKESEPALPSEGSPEQQDPEASPPELGGGSPQIDDTDSSKFDGDISQKDDLESIEFPPIESEPSPPIDFDTKSFLQDDSDRNTEKDDFESQNDSQSNTKQSFESESTKQSDEDRDPAAMESDPESKLPPDLYDDSATDVGIQMSFETPIPEEMIEKIHESSSTPSMTDDIFARERASDDAADGGA